MTGLTNRVKGPYPFGLATQNRHNGKSRRSRTIGEGMSFVRTCLFRRWGGTYVKKGGKDSLKIGGGVRRKFGGGAKRSKKNLGKSQEKREPNRRQNPN